MPPAPELEILALEEPDIKSVAHAWFGGEIGAASFLKALERHPGVNGLARIPLMLALLCRVYGETKPEKVPTTAEEKGTTSFPTGEVFLSLGGG
jgi:hypothetical protein